ncbi:MAG: hypothetical protein ACI4GZ_00820 [Ruminococcus sp.]
MRIIRRTTRHSGFFLCFIINLLINFEWTVPGFVFLGLFIWLKKSVFLWLMIIAFAVFIIYIFVWTLLLSFMNKCSTPTEHRENKNPYSVGGSGNKS